MSPSRLHRLILASYPASFRARYGDEMALLVADCGGGWRVTLDLAVSAAKARLNPDFVTSQTEGRRLRLQTTTGTVFAAWAWSTVAAAVFAWAVDGQARPLRSWGWDAYAVGNVIFGLSIAVILIAGFGCWLRVVLPAARSRNRQTLVPAVLPVVVVWLWLAGTGLLAWTTHRIQAGNYRQVRTTAPSTGGGWALLGVYALFTVICLAACTASTRRALNNAELPEQILTASSLVAAACTITLAAVTMSAAICLTSVLVIGGRSLLVELTAVGPVCLLVLAAASAAVSSIRGLIAFKTSTSA